MSGRACPLSYRMGAQALRSAPRLQCDTLFAVGGLYGNLQALQAVKRRVAEEANPERTHVVLNGDFNFFNCSPAWWHVVKKTLRHSKRP